jgi:tRNA(Ile)-lysidine synthase
LLDVPKARLRATLQARGIVWLEDPSNQSLAFERTRLRAAGGELDGLGLTQSMLALSATRLLRARRALERSVDEHFHPSAGVIQAQPCGYFVVDLARLQAAEAEIALRLLGRAIAGAGGSDEPVPLGKLETIASALRSSHVDQAKWTLARALITAMHPIVTIQREPGREPLPQLVLKPGEQARWDGRFCVEVGPEYAGGTLTVRALGEAGLASLRKQGAAPTHVPRGAAVMVPSFWTEPTLLAVPSLHYWATPLARASLHAFFLGSQAGKSNGPAWEAP